MYEKIYFALTSLAFLVCPSGAFLGPSLAHSTFLRGRYCPISFSKYNDDIRDYQRRNGDDENNEDNDKDSASASSEEPFDWDEDWKRVVRGEIKPVEKGLAPPSEVEKVVLKAKKKAKEIQSSLPKVQPARQGRVGFADKDKDWKFWVGILAVLSIGTSVLSSSNGGFIDPSMVDSYGMNDSAYI